MQERTLTEEFCIIRAQLKFTRDFSQSVMICAMAKNCRKGQKTGTK